MEDLRLLCNQHGYEFIACEGRWLHFKHLGFLFKCRLVSFPPKQLKTSNLVDRKDVDAFVFRKLSEIHNDKYSYEGSVYTGCQGILEVKCKEHGNFFVSYTNHLQGKGCRLCGINDNTKRFTFTLKEFVALSEKVHGKLYDYSDTIYEKNSIKVNIRCKKHGVFSQIPASHWQGCGCPRCGDEVATEKKAAKGFCGYSRSSYCNKVKISNIYLLRLRKADETLYKIGISKRVRQRIMDISSETNYNVSCLFYKQLDSETAYDAEKALQRHFNNLKAVPTEFFKGRTECFKAISTQEFIRVLNNF